MEEFDEFFVFLVIFVLFGRCDDIDVVARVFVDRFVID